MSEARARKIALITGGSRGVGRAIAERLAADGMSLILNYKSDAETARQAADELAAAHGVETWTVQADISDAKAIRGLFKWLKNEGPNRLDILVHNAAFGTMAPLLRTGRYSWNATFDTNVVALLELGKGAHRFLKKQGGSIVGVSSVGAQVVYSEYAAIGTSKAAMETLVRYMAFEWIKDNIRVNCVSAGPTETRAIGWFKHPDAVHEYACRKAPTHRIGTPEDIAPIVSFLVSDDARWVVGQTILADGGITLGENFGDWMPGNFSTERPGPPPPPEQEA